MVINFVARDSDKLAFTAFIVCAGIYNGSEDRKTYSHTEARDKPSTSCKNYVNFIVANR